MTKNSLLRNVVVNDLNDLSEKYFITDEMLNKRLAYWNIDKKLFDKKVKYAITYDDIYKCNYYSNFEYQF